MNPVIRSLLVLSSFSFSFAGCASEPSEFRGLLCSTFDSVCPPAGECIAAIRETDCDDVRLRVRELEGVDFQDCVNRCPIVRRCPDYEPEAGIDCNCYSDCVESESSEARQAHLDLLECEIPPECR